MKPGFNAIRLFAVLALSLSLPAVTTTDDSVIQSYGGKVSVVLTSVEKSAASSASHALKAPGGRNLNLDQRLVLVCRELAARLRADMDKRDQILSSSSVGELLRDYGVYETSYRVFMFLFMTQGDIDSQAKLYLGVEKPGFTEIGVGAQRPDQSGRPGVLVVILTEKRVELEPFPRKVLLPSTVPLKGILVNLCRGLQPSVLVTCPGGLVNNLEVSGNADGFNASVEFNRGPGIYRVEVVASGGGDSRVAALMEVEAGKVSPGGRGPEVTGFEKTYSSEADAEAAMLSMINQFRTRKGLPVLGVDERLTRMAKAHSKDMRDNRYTGHVSPAKGGVERRAAAAGLRGKTVRENVAMSSDLEQGMNNLLESPVHRDSILDPKVNCVGVGIAFDDSNSVRHYYITQEFSEL